MNDKELCKSFGTTIEAVEDDVKKYEKGDLSEFQFGDPIEGRIRGTVSCGEKHPH